VEKKVDVVICTKDRYDLLSKAVNQAKSVLPCNQVIVVDSAFSPNRKLLEGLGVHTVFSPDALLGFARQQGLKAAVTDLVVFLDDDIVLEKDWFRIMKQALDRDPDAVAVSSKIVLGYGTDKVLEKMHRMAIRSEGGSIGISVLKRKEILGLGGFNPHIHRAEDTELHLRIKKHGFKWISEQNAVAYHPLTFKEFMEHSRKDVGGWLLIWKYSSQRVRFIVERTGSALFMPIFYGLLTFDFRVFTYYFLFKFNILISFLRRVNRNP
jgi:glycosyltransferase involved in cell wall biosynthesis